MSDLAHILLTSGVLSAAVLAGWRALSSRLKAAGAGRWRAVAICLPLLLISVAYGLYWLAFFSSAAAAVQTRALWLTVTLFAGSIFPWILAGFAALAVVLLRPLARRA